MASGRRYACPFCSDFFDIVSLCCHLDEDHPLNTINGVCPVCAVKVSSDMVAHITLQHANMFKISFLIFPPTTLVILFTNGDFKRTLCDSSNESCFIHSLTIILRDDTEKESKKRWGSVNAINLEERVS
ncbi:hypothetical protein F2Q69_00039808 [Brassica cretica]|uniref:Di19 zinc-binding domain-containing protein n=1 Tax=Brassica cretica TaxID=69181 RepID=A0A8S9NEA3_BRACR|nr:hypothetical protein F2Q69_00039808 [Brassica cretica]